jgi:hypothetical protein
VELADADFAFQKLQQSVQQTLDAHIRSFWSWGGSPNQMDVSWQNEKTDDVIFLINVVIEHYINVIGECDD